MAVWGAPDGARGRRRASRARRARARRRASAPSGPGIQARAGVLTGEAAVTVGATNQGMVAGDLVNTASRLQSVAPPGTVLVGEATHARGLAARSPSSRPASRRSRARRAPVPAWRALRVVAERGGRDRVETPRGAVRRPRRRAPAAQGPVPRDRRASGVPAWCPSSGPAGIGKSRLAWEFLKYLDGLVETRLVARRAQPGLRRRHHLLGARRDDPRPRRPARGRRRGDDAGAGRRRCVATHVPDDEERRWIEPAMLALLGIERGRAEPEQLFGAWRTFFERLAESAPVVLVFEDFHYADTGPARLRRPPRSSGRRTSPIYVLTLARPELLERRPDWGAGKRSFTSLYLEPLSETRDARAARRARARAARGRGPADRRPRRRHPALRGRDRADAARGRPAGGATTASIVPVGDLDAARRAGDPDGADRLAARRARRRRTGRWSPTRPSWARASPSRRCRRGQRASPRPSSSRGSSPRPPRDPLARGRPALARSGASTRSSRR